MFSRKLLPFLLGLGLYIGLSAHNLFLKTDSYFVKVQQKISLSLFNGTFEKSENEITLDRIQAASIEGAAQSFQAENSDWEIRDKKSILHYTPPRTGTYLAGISTRARMITLSESDFNNYLEHDGIIDVLSARKKQKLSGADVREKYSKHVKAVFQVGDQFSSHYKTVLSYPIEFVPIDNPYQASKGDKLRFKLLFKGRVLANQWVYAGFSNAEAEHSHAEGESHEHSETKLKTNAQGEVELSLETEGKWYLRTIYMQKSKEKNIDYESNWASITFEVQ